MEHQSDNPGLEFTHFPGASTALSPDGSAARLAPSVMAGGMAAEATRLNGIRCKPQQ
jgi:hypothetical protein